MYGDGAETEGSRRREEVGGWIEKSMGRTIDASPTRLRDLHLMSISLA